MRESVTAYWAKPFGVKLKDVFMTSFPRASHQPAAFCVLLLDITCSFHRFSCCYEISVIISILREVVKRGNRYSPHNSSLVVDTASTPASNAARITFLSEINPPATNGISVYPRTVFKILGITHGISSMKSGWKVRSCFLVVSKAMESIRNVR